uniref:Ureidoglycolate hydrolase n=1 Tax=Acrobeloides nanus TaxID=290746 RepID=A0A914C7I2_9BILA
MSIRVSVTLYNPKLIPHSISLIPGNANDVPVKKFNWPRLAGRRKPEGGCDDAIQIETITLSWVDNKLIFPISDEALPIAERKFASEFWYRGSFISQLDGDVGYIPKNKEADFLIIVPDFSAVEETPEQDSFIKYRAIKFPKGSGVFIEAFVPHSTPIPLNESGEFEFDVYKRGTNSVTSFEAPKVLFIHLLSVDRSNQVVIKKSIPHEVDEPEPVLPNDFTAENVVLEEANPVAFSVYGVLVEDYETHSEQIEVEPWPWGDRSQNISSVGALEQDFRLNWEPDSSGEYQEIIFHGLTGSFAGNEGRPGVEFHPESGEYHVNLLMTRPDGSFYVHAKGKSHSFAMIFANPDIETGEPVKSSLKGFIFRHGQAVKLTAGIWHSVPIPLIYGQDSAEFREIIAETNANIAINLQFECNRGLHFLDPMI